MYSSPFHPPLFTPLGDHGGLGRSIAFLPRAKGSVPEGIQIQLNRQGRQGIKSKNILGAFLGVLGILAVQFLPKVVFEKTENSPASSPRTSAIPAPAHRMIR